MSGYDQRARHYSAELAAVPAPDRLEVLLTDGMRVVEMPSGTGHFLSHYAARHAHVTLIDASTAMLQAAALPEGLAAQKLTARIEDLRSASEVGGSADLVVVPNGALNQLAATLDLTRVLKAAAELLAPGGRLLAQVLNLTDYGQVAGCGFYDPDLSPGQWTTDRHFAVLTRRRRQFRDGDLLRLELEFTGAGFTTYRQDVTLRPLTVVQLRQAATAAGLACPTLTAGAGGFAEFTAHTPLGAAGDHR
jgi:SAM-dependent methyltransferase